MSRTVDNLGHNFWACPLEFGGHGWMEWDGYTPTPTDREKRGVVEKLRALESSLDIIEKELHLCKIELEHVTKENNNLKETLKNESMQRSCLTKCLKSIFLSLVLWFLVCSRKLK
ncbi:hypothetical protein LIER_37423 [Lithospermum erythrorhizon]|uniref:Uncharacterized protein n=1 Tax=Lithospermum erythrorhizon TaxID=34254 RepID=A0AAV3PMF8_LITER